MSSWCVPPVEDASEISIKFSVGRWRHQTLASSLSPYAWRLTKALLNPPQLLFTLKTAAFPKLYYHMGRGRTTIRHLSKMDRWQLDRMLPRSDRRKRPQDLLSALAGICPPLQPTVKTRRFYEKCGRGVDLVGATWIHQTSMDMARQFTDRGNVRSFSSQNWLHQYPAWVDPFLAIYS